MSDADSTDASTADANASDVDANTDASHGDVDADARTDTDTDASAESLRVAAETDVPPGATTRDCERCGRPFAREDLLVLHRGLAHYGDLTDAEREAFAAAYDGEGDDIRRFRIVALGGLVLLYFGFLLAYALFA